MTHTHRCAQCGEHTVTCTAPLRHGFDDEEVCALEAHLGPAHARCCPSCRAAVGARVADMLACTDATSASIVSDAVLDCLELALRPLAPADLFVVMALQLVWLDTDPHDDERERKTLMLLYTLYALGMRRGVQLSHAPPTVH